jgi:hypothetical protein
LTIATGEPSGSLYDDVRDLPAVLAELGTAHVRAAALAAEATAIIQSRVWAGIFAAVFAPYSV